MEINKAQPIIKCIFSFADFRCAPIQSGVGAAINGGISFRSSMSFGQERSPLRRAKSIKWG
jgi:hypothetical protein